MKAKSGSTTPRPLSGRTLASFTGRAYELLSLIETAGGERNWIERHVSALGLLCAEFCRGEVRP